MNVIKELWHGNIIPGEDSRRNSKEMKELLGYMAWHHEDLEKTIASEARDGGADGQRITTKQQIRHR